ncbi:MAG: hypothetical protein HGA38_03945 [Candidatus Moranbacteria bacterium]|nr:hypothetical protein [Candidatus Moranbacteria bacterium]
MKQTSSKKTRPVAVALLLVCVLSLSARPAYAWGDAIPAAILKQTLEKIQAQIDGVLLATLKSTTISLLNTRVMSMVVGNSTKQSLIITDWRQYLYGESQQKTKLAYESTFKPLTLQGRASGFNAAGSSGSYESKLSKIADLHLSGGSGTVGSTARLSELSGDPITSIGSGDFRVLSEMFSTGSDPIGYSLRAERFVMEENAKNTQAAQVQAMASGYKGVKDANGNTILPGSTIGQIVSNVQDIGNKIIAEAQNPNELISGAIATLANRMITNVIQNGLGSIQSKLLREVASVDAQIGSRIDLASQTLGRGAAYSSEINQQRTTQISTTKQGGVAPVGVR